MRTHFTIATVILACMLTGMNVQPAHAELREVSGKITMIRVSGDVDAYGHSPDAIGAEVVFQLDGMPGKTYGFRLPNDSKQMRARGMLDLLRDAFAHSWKVTVDCEADVSDVKPDPKNWMARRVMVTIN